MEAKIALDRKIQQIGLMLMRMDSVLNDLMFLNSGEASTDIVERGESWFQEAEARATEVSKFDTLFSGVNTIEVRLIMGQAHDAFILGFLDAVPILCRTALEGELTIRYLVAYSLVQQVLGGTRFKTLVDGKTKANLENLVQWATTTNPQILTGTTLPLVRDVQEVGNDYAHAYAMRRAGKPLTGSGNLFTNTKALEVYKETLTVLNKMPV